MADQPTFKENNTGSHSGRSFNKESYEVSTPPFLDSQTITSKKEINLAEKLRGVPALFLKVKTDTACTLYYSVEGNLIKDTETLTPSVWKVFDGYYIDKIILEPSSSTTYHIHASTVTPKEFIALNKLMVVPPSMSQSML